MIFVELMNKEFRRRKAQNEKYSQRAFARDLDLSISSLHAILNGTAKFRTKTIESCGKKLGWSDFDIDEAIKDAKDKDFFNRAWHTKSILLDEQVFERMSEWYYFSIFHLAKLKSNRADPEWIATKLGITLTQASKAISTLAELKLIRINDGKMQVNVESFYFGNPSDQNLKKLHKQYLEKAIESQDTVEISDRRSIAFNIPIHPELIAKVETEIHRLIEKISRLSQTKEQSEIYCTLVHFFPVSKK